MLLLFTRGDIGGREKGTVGGGDLDMARSGFWVQSEWSALYIRDRVTFSFGIFIYGPIYT